MSSTFQPFQEEHQIFRQQVRTFVETELAPKVDQWEEEKIFPSSVFESAGELGILGAHYPEDVGGGGGDSVQGALVGGLLIGLAEIYAGQYLSGYTGVLGAGWLATYTARLKLADDLDGSELAWQVGAVAVITAGLSRGSRLR